MIITFWIKWSSFSVPSNKIRHLVDRADTETSMNRPVIEILGRCRKDKVQPKEYL